MTTPIIIACCIVIPLVLLTVYGTVRTSYTDKKRKVYEEQEKIRTYGDQINKETRKNINKKKNSSIKELNRIGLRSSVSVYKTELSEHKKMQFYNIDKIANNFSTY